MPATVKWQTLRSNDSGFTLLEVLVAMVIMVVGLLGLLQAVNVSMEHNLRNMARDEASRIADERMNSLLARPFDKISSTYSPEFVPSRIRGVSKNYTVEKKSTEVGGSSLQLEVLVSWAYKGTTQQQELVSLKTR